MPLNTYRLKKSAFAAIAVFVCVLTAALGTICCFADETRYTIKELDDMIITLPDNMSAVTRSSKKSDRYFSLFGLNYDSTMANFKSGNIYLQGMDSASSVTVTVTMTRTDESEAIKNYNLLDSAKLSEVTGNFLSQPEYSSCTSDQTGSIIWLSFNTNVSSGEALIKAYQAHTVYDGMSINVTLQRNAGNVNAEDYALFSKIVSSVAFLRGDGSNGFALDRIVYLIIFSLAAAAALTIIITVLMKMLRKRKKRDRNDRIIRELAGKYNLEDRGFHRSEKAYDEPLNEKAAPEFAEISDNTASERTEYTEIQDGEQIADVTEENRNSEQSGDEAEGMDYIYGDDEELIRQAAKTKFADSDDFFEEAPRKTKGIITGDDLKEAEDFDVIKEIEKKARQVEKKEPKNKKTVAERFASVAGGIKYFGIHFGYFCTNVYRMIKRKRIAKKRRKAELERRERQRMAQARARQQRRNLQSGELVQVHSRTDRRPPQNARPQQKKRPQSGKMPPQSRRPH